MKYRQVRGVAFDLFGTLILPPQVAQFQRGFPAIAHVFSGELGRWVCGGFPGALLAAEMQVPPAKAASLQLTRRCPTTSSLVDAMRRRWPNAPRPRDRTVALVDELTDYAGAHSRLAPNAGALLQKIADHSLPMQLISDVSEPFSRIGRRLGLDRWFRDPLFSCNTAALKKNGNVFLTLSTGERDRWIMIGNSWRSDIVPSVRAGMSAILVDRTRRHPARQLLRDVGPLFELSRDGKHIRIARAVRRDAKALIPLSPRELNDSPARHLHVTDGHLRLAVFDRIIVVDSVHSLLLRLEDVLDDLSLQMGIRR